LWVGYKNSNNNIYGDFNYYDPEIIDKKNAKIDKIRGFLPLRVL
jgi:hypothetical protein